MNKYTITTLSHDEIIRTDYCKNKKDVINFLILNTRINSDVVSALHYRVFDDSQNEMAIEIDAKALLVNALDFVKQFQIVDRLLSEEQQSINFRNKAYGQGCLMKEKLRQLAVNVILTFGILCLWFTIYEIYTF